MFWGQNQAAYCVYKVNKRVKNKFSGQTIPSGGLWVSN